MLVVSAGSKMESPRTPNADYPVCLERARWLATKLETGCRSQHRSPPMSCSSNGRDRQEQGDDGRLLSAAVESG